MPCCKSPKSISCLRMSLFEQLKKDEHGVFSKWKCSNIQLYGVLLPFLKRSLAKLALKVRPNGNTCSPATYILAISLQTIAQVNNNCYLVFLSNYVTTKRKPVSIDFVVIFIFCKIDEVFIGQHTAF